MARPLWFNWSLVVAQVRSLDTCGRQLLPEFSWGFCATQVSAAFICSKKTGRASFEAVLFWLWPFPLSVTSEIWLLDITSTSHANDGLACLWLMKLGTSFLLPLSGTYLFSIGISLSRAFLLLAFHYPQRGKYKHAPDLFSGIWPSQKHLTSSCCPDEIESKHGDTGSRRLTWKALGAGFEPPRFAKVTAISVTCGSHVSACAGVVRHGFLCRTSLMSAPYLAA